LTAAAKSFEPVIGLEVHAELLTRSKMFCGCALVDSTSAPPNSSTCEICTGMPGALPVINQRAVDFALRVALALNCTVAETSVFARKNYFYPDLPKGFQISQYELPLAQHGWLGIDLDQGEKRIGIRRVHLEEDTGKLFHREGYSLVDYNRSGVPLLEIVSEPEMHSAEEVKAYSTGLRSLLRYLGVNSGDMQKGTMRFEANVSVRPKGSDELGTRTEIKNLNSFRAVTRSVAYELERQAAALAQGKAVAQETLGWDENREVTVPQRGKEEADDYRYFPEPDLPPLHVSAEWIEQVRRSLPELPFARRERFIRDYGLSRYAARVLTEEQAVAEYFETALHSVGGLPPEKLAAWLSSDLFGLLNQAGLSIEAVRVTPQALAELVGLVESGRISAASGKLVLEDLFQQGGDPEKIVEARGLLQLSDAEAIRSLVEQVLLENPQQVNEYLGGKTAIAQWFVGQVMRKTGGKADPAVVKPALEAALQARQHNENRESA
jgi:aspartyl-tRNA(Asn)/glutamyl-tRNA(Gln) amidotransferase subunit B